MTAYRQAFWVSSNEYALWRGCWLWWISPESCRAVSQTNAGCDRSYQNASKRISCYPNFQHTPTRAPPKVHDWLDNCFYLHEHISSILKTCLKICSVRGISIGRSMIINFIVQRNSNLVTEMTLDLPSVSNSLGKHL